VSVDLRARPVPLESQRAALAAKLNLTAQDAQEGRWAVAFHHDRRMLLRHLFREIVVETNMLKAAEEESLQDAYQRAQRAAVIEIADQGLISLTQLVDSGAIDVAPRFQRRDRWTADRQSLLIESFLVNIPVPPVYLAEDADRLGLYAVIDGKQRLTAVSAFFGDRLVLRGLVRLPQLNGLRFSDMPEGMRNSLGMKNLRVTTLLRQSNEDLKHEVFLRLNTGGEVLNAQEIRNVAYRGPLNDLVYELAENKFLRNQFKVHPPTSPNYRKMVDAEFVLRFLALSTMWQKFSGDIRTELDQFMLTHRYVDSREIKDFRSRYLKAIESAEAIWGDDAFKRQQRDQALAGLFDAQMIALAETPSKDHQKLLDGRAEVVHEASRLFERREYDEAVRQATNTPARLRYRVEAMQAVFKTVINR